VTCSSSPHGTHKHRAGAAPQTDQNFHHHSIPVNTIPPIIPDPFCRATITQFNPQQMLPNSLGISCYVDASTYPGSDFPFSRRAGP
jgi:hypothetical protein